MIDGRETVHFHWAKGLFERRKVKFFLLFWLILFFLHLIPFIFLITIHCLHWISQENFIWQVTPKKLWQKRVINIFIHRIELIDKHYDFLLGFFRDLRAYFGPNGIKKHWSIYKIDSKWERNYLERMLGKKVVMFLMILLRRVNSFLEASCMIFPLRSTIQTICYF